MKKEFLPYQAEDLAAEEAFIRWVQQGAAADHQQWENWLAAHPEKRPDVEAAKRIVEALGRQTTTASPIDREALWQRIDASTEARIVPLRSRRRVVAVVAVAASIAALLFLGINLLGPERVQALPGESLAYNFPDGSSVKLNAASRLEFRKGKWSDDRTVQLQGEAYFSVEAGAPFTVETAGGRVSVLGTTFNVYSRDEVFRVLCTTGRVMVSDDAGGQGVILEPGEACIRAADGTLERSTPAAPDVEWLNGIFRFDDQPLREVVKTLERQYGVRVQMDADLGDSRYSGFFRNTQLDSALYNITFPLGLRATQKGKTIVIERE